ncbi:MAG: [FeFe] hydrogenase H-cluster maturation GTPase HydF [Butyricicoccus pullicaecorum]|nr:[FeFe] hydrogenase H-cluster maturation GTPase HydF [Butyricicoccus pullicaecorum]
MSLNDTTSSERIHISFFGLRNAGKSSLVNALTGQALAVVSDVKGTTTDPVKKAMELLPLGPVLIIDTAGLDDTGELGALRIQKTYQVLHQTDIAVLVVDARVGLSEQDKALLSRFAARQLPYLIVWNKIDLLETRPVCKQNEICVSTVTGEGIHQLKQQLGTFHHKKESEKHIVADLLTPKDIVVLVIPIDQSAPKGRLILPQQQTIREILDARCTVICCQDTELTDTLRTLNQKPRLVITDSQAFGRVSRDVPADIPLTSFSILFARYKGELVPLVRAAAKLSALHDGDQILISEGCTHHRQCGDIGTVKLPHWIAEFSGVKPRYTFTSGGEFPENLEDYALIVHCGGCMLHEKEMKHRIHTASVSGVPIVNYGIAIAHIHGILARSLEIFPEILALLNE